ncbi:MAG TPA: DUF3883 domain-containing protein [Nitrospira sp.]|jgi:hypothetical protein|nr:DUF3883 domain-containing protein [Nitrospira sp.]
MPPISFQDDGLAAGGSTGQNWTDAEVDAIVADYFDMLAAELAGQPFSKAAHNEALQQVIGRSRKSIEFKHCNISAVLERLGMPIVNGYRPLRHFQNALVDGVDRYLAARGGPFLAQATATAVKVVEPATLWVGPPPTPSPAEGKETPKLRRLIRKYDPGMRDARNRKLGRQGEELVVLYEQRRLASGGREDLALKVEWTSEARGDGAGYDIASFELDGRERLIEVKTTNGPARTPFYLSENERAFSEERPEAFRLFRLYNFLKGPAAFELTPPLEGWVTLNPVSYRATF